jgi:hypothetical protein
MFDDKHCPGRIFIMLVLPGGKIIKIYMIYEANIRAYATPKIACFTSEEVPLLNITDDLSLLIT